MDIPLRPTFAEIDLGAIEYNYLALRSLAGENGKLLCVLKANAYGHGAVPIARRLERLGIDYIGVFIAEEGVELREDGIKVPILVLGVPYKYQLEAFLDYQLEAVISSEEDAINLEEIASKQGVMIPAHIKVDTGMGRLGVPYTSWSKFLRVLGRIKNLKIKGLFTHLADADNPDEEFTSKQIELFNRSSNELKSLGINVEVHHAANSAYLIKHPLKGGEMARVGLALYGAYPHHSLERRITLRPVMSIKSRISLVKNVPQGYTISYGVTFYTPRESRIATIPIGYADGFSRNFSNNGEVLIRGRRAPIVGRVTMDMIMVDITDIKDAEIGDDVVILGSQGKECITAFELAERIGTISYEIFCALSNRVPRKFLN